MTIQLVDPGSGPRRILLDLFGPSGGGKSFSALLLAAGLVDKLGGKIAMIDTEGRGGLYDTHFTYDRFLFSPPFPPEAFIKAYEQLDRQYSVIITDTISDEYEGIGGLLEMAEAQPVKNEVAKWAKPKAEHRRMMSRVRQLRAQHIFVLRAEDKIEIYDGEDPVTGRQKKLVRPLGWTRVAEKKWKYDMTVGLFFAPGAYGKVVVDKTIGDLIDVIPDGRQITREMGHGLANWAKGGAVPTPQPQLQQAEPAPPKAEKLISLYDATGAEIRACRTASDWLGTYQTMTKAASSGEVLELLARHNWRVMQRLGSQYPEEFSEVLGDARELVASPQAEPADA